MTAQKLPMSGCSLSVLPRTGQCDHVVGRTCDGGKTEMFPCIISLKSLLKVFGNLLNALGSFALIRRLSTSVVGTTQMDEKFVECR